MALPELAVPGMDMVGRLVGATGQISGGNRCRLDREHVQAEAGEADEGGGEFHDWSLAVGGCFRWVRQIGGLLIGGWLEALCLWELIVRFEKLRSVV